MNTKTALIILLSSGLGNLCSAQSPSPKAATSPAATAPTTTPGSRAPYTEGSVWEITMVRTKPGMEDDYLRSLGQNLKPIYEEAKKQKTILDYKILSGEPSTRDDFNILILVQYPNMAAFDGLRDKMDPIVEKFMGAQDEQRATAVKRLEIREILGAKTMREITLK